MQIAREVGAKRILRYLVFTLWQGIFDILAFSPLRIWWLRLWGARIGDNTVIDKIDFINLDRTGLAGLTIGQRCFLGRGTLLDLAGQVTLDDWVTISPRVIILSHLNVGFKSHPLLKVYPSHIGHTRLQTGCFIGANATLISGVAVGKNSLIAAGSVATHNIPAYSLAAGAPAQVKKTLKP